MFDPLFKCIIKSIATKRCGIFCFSTYSSTAVGSLLQNSSKKDVPLKSLHPAVQIKDTCFHDLMLRYLQKYEHQIAVVDSESNRKWTYGEMNELCHKLAFGLYNQGLQKGDVVLVCLSNSPEYIAITLAVMMQGGVVSGINSEASEDEIKKHLNTSNAKFVFVNTDRAFKMISATNDLKMKIEKIFLVGSPYNVNIPDSKRKLISIYDNLLTTSSSHSRHKPVKWDVKNDLAMLPFSSGTTGLPKGIMLSHYNLASIMQILTQMGGIDRLRLNENLVLLTPLFHIYGTVQLINAFSAGATVYTMKKFKRDVYLKLLQDSQASMWYIVPPVMSMLAKDAHVRHYDLRKCRTCLTGAAPAGKELMLDFKRRFPHINVVQGYGLTETSGVSHITPSIGNTEEKYASCGLLLPNYESKIVCPETGRSLSCNEAGELLIRSPTITLGYYGNAKATEQLIDNEGFLHTGDIGKYDDDGYLYIVDRIKELIKVRGFQVAPAELEDILLSNKYIEDAAVVGVPDLSSGELPKAFVVLKPGAKLSEFDVKEFVRPKVIHYKQLKGGVQFVDSIPKAASGKILRRLLREMSTH